MILKRDEKGRPIEIFGYKSFNMDATNWYGKVFEEGKCYHCDGDIKFGPNGNGYHFAERMEDTIRYSDEKSGTVLRNVLIAEVIGSGILALGEDDYNGYYDMYSTSDLKIVRFLSREEVIKMALQLREFQLARFISLYRLTSEELQLFRGLCFFGDREIEIRYPEKDISLEKKYIKYMEKKDS